MQRKLLSFEVRIAQLPNQSGAESLIRLRLIHFRFEFENGFLNQEHGSYFVKYETEWLPRKQSFPTEILEGPYSYQKIIIHN